MTKKEIKESVPEGFIYKGFKPLKGVSGYLNGDIATTRGKVWQIEATGSYPDHHYAVRRDSHTHKLNPCKYKGLKELVETSKHLAEEGTEGYVCLGFGGCDVSLVERFKLKKSSLYKVSRWETKRNNDGETVWWGGMEGDCSSFIYYIPLSEYKNNQAFISILASNDAFLALLSGIPVYDLDDNLVTCIDPSKQYKLEKKVTFSVGDRVKVKGEHCELLITEIENKLYLVYAQGVAAGMPRLHLTWTMEEIEKLCEKVQAR